MVERKKKKPRTSIREKFDLFDNLPDDLVVCILCKLSSSASCPADFVNILTTCERLNRLGLHPLVLSRAGLKTLAIRAENWSDSAHRFLKLCVNAGNIEACYTLGMIRFYCLRNRSSGASLMARAAMKSHALALYSLAVIHFNGSGGSKTDKNLRVGSALCTRAARLGHVDALRELGHCLQDGYGVRRDVAEGRRLLVQANAREIACSTRSPLVKLKRCCLLSDFGCAVPVQTVHPANRFMRDWFRSGRGGLGNDMRLCSHAGCGRPETRVHEFRRCSVCGTVNYCSRGCQALDWKLRHMTDCAPVEMWPPAAENHRPDGGGIDMEVVEEFDIVAVG